MLVAARHRCYRTISMLSRRSGASHREARRLPAEVCRNSSATIVTNRCCRTCGTAAAHYAARQLPARCGGLPGRARLPRRLPLAGEASLKRRDFCRKIGDNSAKRCLGWSFCEKNGENSAKQGSIGHFAEKSTKILQIRVPLASLRNNRRKFCRNGRKP